MNDTITTDKSPVRLSELTKEIAGVINDHFANRFYWVIAEITSHKFIAKNGFHYFDLCEKNGPGNSNLTKIACTAFSTGSESIRNFESYTSQKFDSNIEALVKIKVDYSIEYGLRTILYDVDVAFTIGNLEKIKQQTLERLLKQESEHIQLVGTEIYTTNKKLSYSYALKGVALITSKESEGYRDFMHTLTENDHGYKFHIFNFFSKVQSDNAADEIIACLKTIYTNYRQYIDVVVICRGGGAQTDFLTFNQFNLCRAVARFPIPIITGIGHHSNHSLVDTLVRTETKTPTKAAEFIVNHCHLYENNILSMQKAISINTQRIIALKYNLVIDAKSQIINLTKTLVNLRKDELNLTKNALVSSSNRLISKHKDEAIQYHHSVVASTYRIIGNQKYELIRLGSVLANKPISTVAIKKNNLINETERLKSFLKKYSDSKRSYLAHFVTLFKHLDVEKTLAKGFAIIRKGNEVITDPSKIYKNDQITIQLKNSLIKTSVIDKKDGTGLNL